MSEIQWGGELVACVTEGFVEVFGDGAAIGMEAFFFSRPPPSFSLNAQNTPVTPTKNDNFQAALYGFITWAL